MTKDEELEPEGQPRDEPPKVVDPVRRSTLRGPGGATEAALGLEMARLFGISPKLLVHRPSRPESRPTPPEEGATDGGSESIEDGDGGD